MFRTDIIRGIPNVRCPMCYSPRTVLTLQVTDPWLDIDYVFLPDYEGRIILTCENCGYEGVLYKCPAAYAMVYLEKSEETKR